jgi:mercuric ion transport protein
MSLDAVVTTDSSLVPGASREEVPDHDEVSVPVAGRVSGHAGTEASASGIIGTVVTAVCCFTPVLVVTLGVLGLSAWLGWLDLVLFPLLALFVGLTALAVYRLRRS